MNTDLGGATSALFQCSRCALKLDATQFYSKGNKRDYRCKTCVSKIAAKRYRFKQSSLKKRAVREIHDDFTVTEERGADREAIGSLEFLLREFVRDVLWREGGKS